MLRVLDCRYRETSTSDIKSGFVIIGHNGRVKHIINKDGDLVPSVWELKCIFTSFNIPIVW